METTRSGTAPQSKTAASWAALFPSIVRQSQPLAQDRWQKREQPYLNLRYHRSLHICRHSASMMMRHRHYQQTTSPTYIQPSVHRLAKPPLVWRSPHLSLHRPVQASVCRLSISTRLLRRQKHALSSRRAQHLQTSHMLTCPSRKCPSAVRATASSKVSSPPSHRRPRIWRSGAVLRGQRTVCPS